MALSRWRLRDGQRESAPACDIDYSERVNLQSPARLAQPLKKCPSPNVCLPLFGRKDASCAEISSERVECRQQHALVKVGLVKRFPELLGDGAFRVVAVATQVAVDATAQHKDRDE